MPTEPEDFDDWRGEMLSRIRGLIRQAVPEVVEDIKWGKPSNPSGVPVWSPRDGIVLTGETYKDKVNLACVRGPWLLHPADLSTSSLERMERRAIELYE